jgi:colicin import membrane protein
VTTTGAIDIRVRRLGRGTFVGGVFATLLIHGGLGGLAYYAHMRGPPPPEGVHDLMVTRLVSLGKPREKFWLPRLPTQPKPKPVEKTIKVSEDLNAAPAQKEAPKVEDKNVSKDLKKALERARTLAQTAGDEPPEGSLTGSTRGTASEASVGDEYATAIYEAIRKNWNVPTGLSLGAVSGLVVEIRVSVDESGTLGPPRLTRTSGNDLFDSSCMEAIQTTRTVPPPPAAVRAKFKRGMILEFDGKDLAR